MRVTGALKTVAVFEAFKGLLVLLLGSGVLSLLHLHRDIKQMAAELIEHYHLDPAAKLSRSFLKLAGEVHDGQLWFVVILALVYVIVRFIEAYGLWHEKTWAEWLTALSGGIYIPFEIAQLLRDHSWWTFTILITNVAIVAFMAYCLISKNATRPVHLHHST